MRKLIFLIQLLAILAGCRQSGLKPNYSTPSFIIDSHTHYTATDKWEKSFLEVYARHNALACLLIDMEDIYRGIAFAKAHPDRVIFFGIQPFKGK